MNFENFTNPAQELLSNSVKIATENQNPVMVPLHTIAAGIENYFCRSFFQALNVPLQQLGEKIFVELAVLPKVRGSQLGMDYTMQEFLQKCQEDAKLLGDSYIGLEIFLLQWARGTYLPASLHKFLETNGFNVKSVKEQMNSYRKGKTVADKNQESQYNVLEKYTTNLTKMAREGKLDPVIGREEEIRRTIQILSRRTKNNPVLIGEPGVGKTAIVEGIAQRIVNNDVPEGLQNSEILGLDLGLLIAGAKFQGEFEERLKNVLKEIEESEKNIVLFIDELHMLVGAGASGSGGMDASNLLKPALARGELHCIGATTLQEYKKYIEKDAALERRFQKVLVEEPDVQTALSILRGLKEKYELHHGIKIKDQALVNAVHLSNKYISDRFLPDKAIDLMDEAASMVKMSIDSMPEQVDKLDRRIRQLEVEKVALQKEKDDPNSKKRLDVLEKELSEFKEQHKIFLQKWKTEKEPLEKINKIKEQIDRATYEYQSAEREGDYAKASEIKYGKLVRLESDLQKEHEKLKNLELELVKFQVDEDDISSVLARWTKIPVEKLKQSETERLLAMDKVMQERVIGQQDAIEKVVNAIQMHRAGLTDPNRPIGSFLFLGPTGVGKTEVAKTLAEFLFNDPHKIIRIDMSEYMEKHAVARLIGAPPGYVGYEEGGQLTEQVRRNPYSVILFDEIEKAHPDVFNIFLQILDEGHLTDSQGRTVSFKNCIIIMTSNIGAQIILDAKELDEKVREEVRQLLYKHFRPEFLNRIDSIIFFKRLTEKDVAEIAKIQIKELENRMKERGIVFAISDAVFKKIAQEGYEKEFGARPLKRVIQSQIISPLSRHILANPDSKDIKVDLKNDQIVIS